MLSLCGFSAIFGRPYVPMSLKGTYGSLGRRPLGGASSPIVQRQKPSQNQPHTLPQRFAGSTFGGYILGVPCTEEPGGTDGRTAGQRHVTGGCAL